MPDGFGDNGMSGRPAVSITDNGMIASASGGSVPMADPLDTVAQPGGWPRLLYRKFPSRAWDPALRAQILVAEFAETPWRKSVELAPWNNDPAAVAAEVAILVSMQNNQRAARMGEITVQSQDFTPYFSDMMMMTPASHPTNWLLLSAAMAIGHMVGMYFKDQNNRPRPVQVYPSLLPPVPTPPHPSYPNNHALQSYLIAEVLAISNPAAAQPLRELASRIKANREIGGFHFPSDGEASRKVGEQVVDIMKQGCLFKNILEKAMDEWGDVTVLPPASP